MKTRKLTAITAIVASFVLFGVAIFTSCGSKDEPINPKVKPNYISLNRSTLNMLPGESYQLIATVEPENADDKSVIWTIDGSAATVNDEGVVTLLCGQLFQSTTRLVGDSDNPIACLGLAVFFFAMLLENAEGDGRLCRCA